MHPVDITDQYFSYKIGIDDKQNDRKEQYFKCLSILFHDRFVIYHKKTL